MTSVVYIDMYRLSTRLSLMNPGDTLYVTYMASDGVRYECSFSRDNMSYTYRSDWQTLEFDRFLPMGRNRMVLNYENDPMEMTFRGEYMTVEW